MTMICGPIRKVLDFWKSILSISFKHEEIFCLECKYAPSSDFEALLSD